MKVVEVASLEKYFKATAWIPDTLQQSDGGMQSYAE